MPDEQKLSTSSDEPLVEAGDCVFEAKLQNPRKSRRLIFAAVTALAALFIIGCCIIGAILYVFIGRDCGSRGSRSSRLASCGGRGAQSPLFINLAIYTSGVPQCDINFTDTSRLPCMRKRKLVTGGKETRKSHPMAMQCRDDAFEESKLGPNNCAGNPFHLVDNGTGVVIPENGVYRVHSTVTFDDAIKFYLSAIIRITPSACATDPSCANADQQRDSASHGWLSCFNHNGPAFAAAIVNKFSTCTLDGVRRFAKGDVVSLMVTQSLRSINPSHKVTRMVIHRL